MIAEGEESFEMFKTYFSIVRQRSIVRQCELNPKSILKNGKASQGISKILHDYDKNKS